MLIKRNECNGVLFENIDRKCVRFKDMKTRSMRFNKEARGANKKARDDGRERMKMRKKVHVPTKCVRRLARLQTA